MNNCEYNSIVLLILFTMFLHDLRAFSRFFLELLDDIDLF